MANKCQRCGSDKTEERAKPPHVGLYCAGCGAHLGWVPQPITIERARAFVMPFGKYKGLKLTELPLDYLSWLADNCETARVNEMAKLLRKAPLVPKQGAHNILDDIRF